MLLRRFIGAAASTSSGFDIGTESKKGGLLSHAVTQFTSILLICFGSVIIIIHVTAVFNLCRRSGCAVDARLIKAKRNASSSGGDDGNDTGNSGNSGSAAGTSSLLLSFAQTLSEIMYGSHVGQKVGTWSAKIHKMGVVCGLGGHYGLFATMTRTREEVGSRSLCRNNAMRVCKVQVCLCLCASL